MTIPRIIHQTWKTPHAHPALVHCMQSFNFMNPGWERRFYTDADCVSYVETRCPQYLAAYKAYKTGIHRADFFRMLVLYFDGGVYADIDVECLRPLDELLSRLPAGKSVYLTRDHPVHERIHFGGRAMWMNDFMIAAPGDPLIGEILEWMVLSPPGSGVSASAVMETGPGVVSSVIEMLGGITQIPGLGVIPAPWVHPLPDMNCGFPEKPYYGVAIHQRTWLRREVFVVHYWFHTWVGAQTNTLTDYADVLMSTMGEQVERKLQWLLGATHTALDGLIASALAEFAEVRGVIRLLVSANPAPMTRRFLEILDLSGLKLRIQILCGKDVAWQSSQVMDLQAVGAEIFYPDSDAVVGAASWSGKALWVAEPGTIFADYPHFLAHEVNGFFLGPPVEGAALVAEADGVCLSEVISERNRVPNVVHILPAQGADTWATSALFFQRGWRTRHWSRQDLEQVLSDASLGAWDPNHLSDKDHEVAASLAVLEVEGGLIYEGNRDGVAEALAHVGGDCFYHGQDFWLLSCRKGSALLQGSLRQWVQTRLRSRSEMSKAPVKKGQEVTDWMPVDMPTLDFLKIRLRQAQRMGLCSDFKALRLNGNNGSAPKVTTEVLK